MPVSTTRLQELHRTADEADEADEVGDDALRTGPERAETGEKAALRRRLQAQIETSALADFNGPTRKDVVPDELPVVNKPKLRTEARDVRPLPSVEPALPTQ